MTRMGNELVRVDDDDENERVDRTKEWLAIRKLEGIGQKSINLSLCRASVVPPGWNYRKNVMAFCLLLLILFFCYFFCFRSVVVFVSNVLQSSLRAC